MRSKRVGAVHKSKEGVFEKLLFLEGTSLDGMEEISEPTIIDEGQIDEETVIGMEQQVITDNQEYYEVSRAMET